MSETEVYYVVRFRETPDSIWKRVDFKDGDRTHKKSEANASVESLKAAGFEAVRSKYTITCEDSTDDPRAEITARLRGIGWVTSRTSKTDTCWGCQEFKVVYKTYNGGATLPYLVCHPCARIARLPID